uniref:acyl-CoA dehydrogenase family protein n=1 Tax=Bordetella sputigena TaxID=1416810 RepID=UPI0039EEE6A6
MEYAAQLRMIGESAAHFAAAQAGPAVARAIHEGGASWDMKDWKGIADLGWFGIAVPEARDGLGWFAPSAVVVAEEAGRALMMPPVAAGIVAAGILAQGGDAAHAVLEDALRGDALVVPAPVTGDGDGAHVATLVPDAATATHWLLATGVGSSFEARLVRKDTVGTRYETRVAVDGSTLADVRVTASAWRDAPVVLDGEPGMLAWRRGRHLLWLLDAAYLSGLAQEALKLALDYMRLRRQFRVPIGSFQALQHRAAMCHVDSKASRALVHEAARAWGGRREDWAAAAAQHRAAACALRVTKEVVQFHGAIGYADEHDAGLYLRRAMTVGARHGRDVARVLVDVRRPHGACG